MERYKMIKEVGDGTFGSVWRAIKKQTGEIVAIKKMKRKYYSWAECMNLREVKSLRKMNHPNIVKLKEVIRENDVLYFIFEYMECNLYQLIKDRSKVFTEVQVRNWSYQIFQALVHMHQLGYFHRDLKPENLLVTKDTIKIADFGLAREISSRPPFTEYVSTRWYRAPEILLQSTIYNSAVDMWAMGAIMAELLTLRPLFPGSSEADEIHKICCVIGSPNVDLWAEGLQLAKVINYEFPQLDRVQLASLIPSASDDAIDLISSLCSWNPQKRPTAAEVLQHSFFKPCLYVAPSLRMKALSMPRTPPVGVRGSQDAKSPRGCSTGSLSSAKPSRVSESNKPVATLRPGVQRSLEVDYEDASKSGKVTKSCSKQPPYRSPARSNSVDSRIRAPSNLRKVSDAADRLSKLTVSKGTRLLPQSNLSLLNMKAGGCNGPTDDPRRSHEISPARGQHSRKVVG